MSPFVRLDVLEAALLVADCVEFLTGPASVSCSRHCNLLWFLVQLVLARVYQNVRQVVHERYIRKDHVIVTN